MSRSKPRHKRPVAQAPRGLRRIHVILLIVAFLSLTLIVWLWWDSEQGDAAFLQQVQQGQPAVSQVRSFPSEGLAQHVPQGSPVYYRTDPPTTGAHYPTPSDPGYYEKPQLPGNLVHALEHGHIVIYYDRPSAAVMQRLKAWASRFENRWDGVIVAPMPGIGEQIILTAWTKELRLV